LIGQIRTVCTYTLKKKTMSKPIKLIFFGSSEFGIPILDELRCASYEIVAVVTSIDKPAGRSKQLKSPIIKLWSQDAGIKVIQPTDLKDPGFLNEIVSLHPDLIIIAAFGKIIPGMILDIPKFGSINVHPSLLPKWRGPSPIQNVILSGEKETSVTLMLTDEKMDHGPIIIQEKTYVDDKDTYISLTQRCASLGAELLIKTLPKWLEGRIKPQEQDHSLATFTKIISRDDGKIDWSKSADEIDRTARAYYPWPGAFTFLPDGKRLKLLEVRILNIEDGRYESGTVFLTDTGEMAVACGKNALMIEKVQKEGGEPMDGKSFLNGHRNLIKQELRS